MAAAVDEAVAAEMVVVVVAGGVTMPDVASIPEAPQGGMTASVVGVAATLLLAAKNSRHSRGRGATVLPTSTAVVAAAVVES